MSDVNWWKNFSQVALVADEKIATCQPTSLAPVPKNQRIKYTPVLFFTNKFFFFFSDCRKLAKDLILTNIYQFNSMKIRASVQPLSPATRNWLSSYGYFTILLLLAVSSQRILCIGGIHNGKLLWMPGQNKFVFHYNESNNKYHFLSLIVTISYLNKRK